MLSDMKTRLIRLFSALLLLSPVVVRAQVLEPVKWSFSSTPDGDSAYLLHMKASIDEGWHLYAQEAGEGPIPTSFSFQETPGLRLDSGVAEHGKAIRHFDKVFNSELKYYEKEVDFVQRVVLTGPGRVTLSGSLEYMVCNDVSCLPPKEVPFHVELGSPAAGATPAAATAEDDASSRSLGWIFWACFAGGFLALITPCVFSMIPITVGFFTKQSGSRAAGIRNALGYSLSIILIYTSLGFVLTLIFGPNALNQLASNIWVNLLFFLVFLLFGISFLGAFEITLPSSWSTRAGARAGLSSFWGIFFMALTLSIVSFSCTGPIIGNLLAIAFKGGKTGPLVGMFGFSLALAIPFALFAIFPGWLSRMGKAGGWLNAVKVVLGLLEIALALKFLSNVDMAYHWNTLSREVFLSIWIVLFGVIGLYLLGLIRFHGDKPLESLSVPRLFFAVAALAFMLYLVPGLFGAQLRGLVGGFLPNYSSIVHGREAAPAPGAPVAEAPAAGSGKKYADLFARATPEGYTAYYDYAQAMAQAQKEKKPLLIDFTGWSCVNCRKMEAEVWTDPGVQQLINGDFVLLQLYVDDKTLLPDSEQYVSSFDGSRIKRLGNKNADFEIVRFNRNSQPYYVVLDGSGTMLSRRGYSAQEGYDPQRFIAWLKAAREAYGGGRP